MNLREKHLKARKEKKELKKEIALLQEKIRKREKKILKKEASIEALNKKIKKYKCKLRKRCKEAEQAVKAKKKKNKKAMIAANKALVPGTEKSVAKIKKTSKVLVPTPDKSLRIVQEDKKIKKVIKEDLTVIEGIGEKTEQILNEKGIQNYMQLASHSSDQLKEMIKDAFPNWRLFDTLTWPEQGLLAASGQWEELKSLQDKIH